ncbi:hypothetical protein C8F04DRAFT_1349641 [Mycena alexandri]|uniref:ubiquitinyl hydrolase 1 n=1 Tax=Mycena alexandri TaxID=1745969 RepID=A0AAD6SXW7_9AGAR|nr:hypothetical protein C8F04DRAFT_1349641 [Mycena alexandri]
MPFPSPAVLLPVLQQTAPLLVLVLVPLFTLRIFAFLRPRLGFLVRILALGMALLGWLGWGSSSSSSSSSSLDDNDDERRRKKGTGRVRTRADQVAEANRNNKNKGATSSGGSVAVVDPQDARFPGLVNLSGTHCFMNSTLQALASLHALPPYLLAIRARAEATDVPTPVVDALLDLLAQLNTPSSALASSSSSALRPVALVEALCTPLVCAPTTSELDAYSTSSTHTKPTNSTHTNSAAKNPNDNFSSALTAFWDARGAATVPTSSSSRSSTKATALLASHEHQDAQELFQLLSECVREEAGRVGREGGGRGIGVVALSSNSTSTSTSINSTSSAWAGTSTSSIAFPAARGVGLAAAVGLDDDSRAVGAENSAHANDQIWHPPPSPFDGLTATRRACVRCGYTAAIRHFSFDSVQLALDLGGGGGGWGGTSLPALLASYTALEVLHDCPCRRCALRATARRLADEVAKLESGSGKDEQMGGMIVTNGHVGNGHHAGDQNHDAETEEGQDKQQSTPSRVRRLKAVRRMEARVRWALEAGRIEEEELEGEWEPSSLEAGEGGGMLRSGTGTGGDALKGVRIERVAGGVCTRQSMLGRPPPILALHINRSVHTGLRTVKNGARVAFPELLDLGPYTTGGVLNLDPTAALSGNGSGALGGGGWEGGGALGGGDAKQEKAGVEECLYRLSAVVCHYGQHAFGHYVCYRRAPVPVSSPSSTTTSITTPFSADSTHAPAPPTPESSAGTGAGWLRISDARVDRVGVEAVLAEGSAVFMLYYERVVAVPAPSPSIPATGAKQGLTMTASSSAPLASAHTPTPTPTLPISSSMPSLPTVTAVYAGAGVAEGEADSAETLRPGQFAGVHAANGGAVSSGSASSGGMAGLLELSPKARVVRSVSLGMGARRAGAGSSVSSLRSVSPSSSFVSVASSAPGPAEAEAEGGAPGTPRARAVEESREAQGQDVDVLVLSADKGDDRQEDATTLPTPPPTPRSTVSPSPPPASSTSSASPSPAKTQKRKKKKKGGKGE